MSLGIRWFCMFLGIVGTTNILAQEGDLFLTHHHHNIPGIDDVNYQIIADSKGQLYVANRSGIIEYDGNSWRHIPTPSAAISFDLDQNDQLYVGCVGDFGVLKILDKISKWYLNTCLSLYFWYTNKIDEAHKLVEEYMKEKDK